MNAGIDWHLARALLEWQLELGATEAIGDAPVNRLAPPAPVVAAAAAAAAPVSVAVPATAPAATAPAATAPATGTDDPVAVAEAMAAAAGDLAALAQAMADYPHCELRRGARSCVFADGNPSARVMIVGEGPGREEDIQGLPFVGPAGRLLDQMFAAIGLSRAAPDLDRALYITNTVPWRPPGNREPTDEELALLRPFLFRHIELAAPRVLVLMGNAACRAVLGKRGITRLRGVWAEFRGIPVLPTFHPSNLFHAPENKREVWADLLALNARLKDLP